MKVDTTLEGPLAQAAAEAARAEAEGYDGIFTTEIAHEPFFPLLLASAATEHLTVGTGIAVAFARSPMTTAYAAWDLNAHSGGRFLLGLGSQIKPHIERRFSMPWGQPAARMKEYVSALKEIWESWQNGTSLSFEGDFYTHTLMTPFFDPGPTEAGAPPVLIAAVGEGMTRIAGEVADGMLVHSFTTERYLREVTSPLLREGLSARGADRADFQVVYPALVAVGDGEEQLAAAIIGTRKQIAFYASTPAYKGILELHGWGDLQTELHTLSKQDRWDEMGGLIDDDVLHTFAVVGSTEDVPGMLQKRFDGVVDRIRLYQPYDSDPEVARLVLAGLKNLQGVRA
jgi:probable F420-dependent oxidoreductase